MTRAPGIEIALPSIAEEDESEGSDFFAVPHESGNGEESECRVF